jgi:hypothetical protein
MTYPPSPPQSGMPPWARWTLIGCAGCLTIAILGVVGCGVLGYFLVGKHVKTIDVSDKPDLPLTATAGQLLPARVDSFMRRSVTHLSPQIGGMNLGPVWKADYVSGAQHVELQVKPSAAARRAPSQPSPFGSAPPQPRGPNTGIHVTFKMGAQTIDMITWAKPNWTFTVQSPDSVAEEFVRAYHPGKPTAKSAAKT